MLKDLVSTIKDNDTIWIMENRENSDSFFKTNVTDKLFSSTYVIVSKSIAYVFVHKLDEGNIKLISNDNCKIYVYDSSNLLYRYINDVLKELNYPYNMLLSYTTMSDENTDIISHSAYLRLSRMFRKIYRENEKKLKIKSAEMNIYEIISKYNSDEINKLKNLADITNTILEKSFKSIKCGQSEVDIANNTINITKDYLEKVKDKYGIIDYDMAWDICPIVLIGDNLKKGGHALPSDLKIKPGDTIYYDFGIKATFEDGKVLYTDMQRMGYYLKENESNAPKEVIKVFNTLVNSITLGINKMKPNTHAYVVDNAVRGKILENNYPDYPHATGHPVGRQVHGAGALISYKAGKRAKLKLVENGIYTLEPRVNIPNGGSIEEMILVTKDGAIPLSDRQLELYLIK